MKTAEPPHVESRGQLPLLGFTPETVDVAHARRTDPETSHEAAASIDRIRESQEAVLEALRRHGPMIDEELVERVSGQSPSGIRSRRAELVVKGMVRFSGSYSVTASNRRTRIWEVDPHGR